MFSDILPVTVENSVVAVKGIASVLVEDETILLNLDSGIYYGLDAVGTRVWELIQEPRRIQEICNLLLEEYEVEAGLCERDTLSLFGELFDQGLIVVVENAPSL